MTMSAFDRISARTPNETRIYTAKTLDLVERIQAILQSKGMTQKDLAEKLEKSPSEISRWMTGLHNFNLKTLVKIEEALGEEVFCTSAVSFAVSKRDTGLSPAGLLSGISSLPAESQQQILDFIEFVKHKSVQKENSSASNYEKFSQKSSPASVNEPGARYRQKKGEL